MVQLLSNPDWIANLTADVWLNILEQVTMAQSIGDLWPQFGINVEKHVHIQAQSIQLRLVCRVFRDMLQQHQPLSQHVLLSQSFNSEALPSFERWLKRHGTAVRSVVAYNSTSTQQQVLELLSIRAPGLARVLVGCFCTPAVVDLLCSFRNMAVCEIQTISRLNVAALDSLESLRSLQLAHGWFTAAQLPPNLTELKLRDADLQTGYSCSCVTSLKTMSVVGSHMYGLDRRGLLACTRLDVLRCEVTTISASRFDNEAFSTRPPVNFLSADKLSALGEVREFSLVFCFNQHSAVELEPLYALTSLETLNLRWTAARNMPPVRVLTGFTALSRLSQITFVGYDCSMELDVDWGFMHELQSLKLHCVLYCNKQILELSTLSSLRHVDMTYCESGNDETRSAVNKLVCNMKAHCPRLEVLEKDRILS